MAPESNAETTMKVKGSLASRTSYKITFKGSKDITHWRIRKIISSEDGEWSYKTIKTLKRSQKTYTVKNLKKNKYYNYEIVGCRKKKGKYKPLQYDYLGCYTGISTVGWDDYASSDAPWSTESITLWGQSYDDGLAVKGYKVYRRKEGETSYKKIATIKRKSKKNALLRYVDEDVEPKAIYYYRFRAYGTYKKKKLYSPYSEDLVRSAVNMHGRYTATVISRDSEKMEVCITSNPYNGILRIRSRDDLQLAEDWDNIEEWEGLPLTITAWSRDGENWTTLGQEDEIVICGDEQVYLQLARSEDYIDWSEEDDSPAKDLLMGNYICSEEVDYNRLPSCFKLELDGEGVTWMNMDLIH